MTYDNNTIEKQTPIHNVVREEWNSLSINGIYKYLPHLYGCSVLKPFLYGVCQDPLLG